MSRLAACEEKLARLPDGEEGARCLYDLGRGSGPSRDAAAHRLEELHAARPGDPWFGLYLANLRLVKHDPGAEELYRETAELSARRGLPRPEVSARWGLSQLLRNAGHIEQAAAEVGHVVRISQTSDDRFLRAQAALLQASHQQYVGEMGSAYETLRQAREAVEADGSYPLMRIYLSLLGEVAQQTGRFTEARAAFRHLAERAAVNDDPSSAATGLYGLASTRLEELNAMPTAAGRVELLGLARQSHDAARAARRPTLEAQSLWMLASVATGPEAREHLERCLVVAETPSVRSFCQAALARRLAGSDPAAAEEAIQQALALARESQSTLALTYAWHERMRVSWILHPPATALEDSRAALTAIEALRNRQAGSGRQPGLFSTWAEDYYWLSGLLLRKVWTAEAFGVIERMRARSLIDALGLEPALADVGRIDFVSLPQLRRALAPDEALLSFQIAPARDLLGDFGGGAWLVVSTRSATRVYPLPDRVELHPKVSTFLGMFEARDGSEAAAAATLYRELLGAALADLPAGIRRLVIVPDDLLHRLPFAALRSQREAAPLVERYQISLAPSATLWLRWQQEPPPSATRTPVLVFAAPPAPRPGSAAERATAFGKAVHLGELPLARQEGRSVVDHLGGGSALLLGENASEERLKRDGVGRFVMVHFATHSLTDDVEPDRSFVYLAPGSPRQDGLLHVREIVELKDFRGRIVVLSSCESASGEILRGEGVMGLARAFFQAGASTVVASLRKLRDDDGAALFDRFYEHVAEGMSVAAALQAAQCDRRADGAPADAWAGVVVLGDGDQVPLPGGRKLLERWWPLSLLGLMALVLLLVCMARRRRVLS